MNSFKICLLAFCVSTRLSSVSLGGDDPAGWGVLKNRTMQEVKLGAVFGDSSVRNLTLAPNQSTVLTESAAVTLRDLQNGKEWKLDLAPPERPADIASYEGLEFKYPLGPLQYRRYKITANGKQIDITSGFEQAEIDQVAHDYQKEMRQFGFNLKILPIQEPDAEFDAPKKKEQQSAALHGAYCATARATITEALNKQLDATHRSWKGLRLMPPMDVDVKKDSKLFVLADVWSPVPVETEEFMAAALAASLGIQRSEVDLRVILGPAAAASNTPLKSQFVSKDGLRPLLEPARAAALNRLQKLGLQMILPATETANSFEVLSEWNHDAVGVPTVFENASVRFRIRVKCVLHPKKEQWPASVDITCSADVETKAKSADKRDFRRLASISGFEMLSFNSESESVAPGKKGKLDAKKMTVEQQIRVIEESLIETLGDPNKFPS